MAAIEEVLVALEAVPQSDPEAKVEALKALTALVDPSDESYEVQRAAADHAGVLHVLMQLLDDDHEAVVVEAANCLAALSDHAGVVTDRLEAGHFAATPEKVALNPVQEEVGELEGVFSALVNLKFADSEPVASAGNDALAALTSLNRTNTVALVHEVVHRLTQGEARALLALDDLVAGLDVRDDVSVLLDQALSPALGFLRGGAPQERVAAATLLGSIAEGRRGAASYLAAEGALAAAAEMLVEGDLEARDVCAHLVWVLVKGDRKLLSPSKGALGVEGVRLLDPLMELVEKRRGRGS
ncbi:MAG: hypothetical protein J3K34DRAFT_178828 [Monoraphidium minutum]|nr:MAG: hypothetical protein J3K34DRAFT_178828 [Monoraphidium minutum]